MEYSGYIALNSKYLLGELDLKQVSILFDKLYFDEAEFNQCLETISYRMQIGQSFKTNSGRDVVEVIKSNVADVEYLCEKGILIKIDPLNIEQKFVSHYPDSTYSKFLKTFADNTLSSYFETESIMSSMVSLSMLSQRDLFNSSYENTRAVTLSDIVGILENKTITPIFNPTGWKINDAANYTVEQNVLEIVISKFPTMESKKVSWERIIDFKNDQETLTNLLRLRNWMIDIAKSNLKSNEIYQKLDYLLNEYETYLKRHQFEFKYSFFKDVLITTSEILEKALTLKFSEAAKAILTIGNHKLKLMDIKENAPGKEVAIYHQVNTML